MKGVTNESDLNKFYTAFNTNQTTYTYHLKAQNQILSSVSNRYGFQNFNQNQLNDLLSAEILEIIILDETNFYPQQLPDPVNVTLGTNCRRRYNNDLAIAFAAAVLGHIACSPLDAAGGFPGFLCHSAVALAHIGMNDNAYLNYLDCLNN